MGEKDWKEEIKETESELDMLKSFDPTELSWTSKVPDRIAFLEGRLEGMNLGEEHFYKQIIGMRITVEDDERQRFRKLLEEKRKERLDFLKVVSDSEAQSFNEDENKHFERVKSVDEVLKALDEITEILNSQEKEGDKG